MWEGHNIWKKSLTCYDVYLVMSKQELDFFQNCVALRKLIKWYGNWKNISYEYKIDLLEIISPPHELLEQVFLNSDAGLANFLIFSFDSFVHWDRKWLCSRRDLIVLSPLSFYHQVYHNRWKLLRTEIVMLTNVPSYCPLH